MVELVAVRIGCAYDVPKHLKYALYWQGLPVLYTESQGVDVEGDHEYVTPATGHGLAL